MSAPAPAATASATRLTPRMARMLTLPRLRLMRLIAERGGADGWTSEPFTKLAREAGFALHSGGNLDRIVAENEAWIEVRLDPKAPRRGGAHLKQLRLTKLGQAVRFEALYALFGDLIEDGRDAGARS